MVATPARQGGNRILAGRDSFGTREWSGNGVHSTNGGRDGASTPGAGNVESLARALGWFSLGLGLAQIAAPARVAQLIGRPGDEDDQKVMRLLGAREIASGFGILAQTKPTPWLWSRVGGDAMDLALLKSAMDSPRSDRNRVATATMAVLGITAADLLASTRMAAEPNAPYEAMQARDVHATAAITVQAPISEVFGYWDGFQSLPRFMSDAASVQITGDQRSHWTLSAPAGMSLEWDAEITDSRPNEQISWRTAEGASVSVEGTVRFRNAPGDRGTQVIFDAHFNPPGGELGKKIAGIFAEALGTKIGNDLRRFKQLVELGEIVHSDDSIIPGPNPAQPTREIPAGVSTPMSAI
jgi:uncharacterized membrane protein